MTRPTAPDAAAPDVLAAEYDPAPDLRRVFAMHSASPPEGSDDGDRSPAINRVVASLAGGYCSTNLDVRDVRCLVVAFADAEGIIDALNSQLASARADLARLRAPAADAAAIGERAAAYTAAREHVARVLAAPSTPVARLRAAQECDLAAEASAADVLALLALLAAERERHAAELTAHGDALARSRRSIAAACDAAVAEERERHAAEVAGARAAALREGMERGFAIAQTFAVPVVDGGADAPGVDWTDAVVALGDAVAALGAKGGA